MRERGSPRTTPDGLGFVWGLGFLPRRMTAAPSDPRPHSLGSRGPAVSPRREGLCRPVGPAAPRDVPEAPDCWNPAATPGFACSFRSSSSEGVATILKTPTSQALFCSVARVTLFLEPGAGMGHSAPQAKDSSTQTCLSSRGECRAGAAARAWVPIRTRMHGSDPHLPAGPSC